MPSSSDVPDTVGPLAHSATATPDWYPAWARELAELYYSGATCVFVLHGNVQDVTACPASNGGDRFVSLSEFLSTQVFGEWDVVVGYDLGSGMRPLAGSDSQRLRQMVKLISDKIGVPAAWPRSPEKALAAVNRLIRYNLLAEDASQRSEMAVMFPFAQYLVPSGDVGMQASGPASRLVRFLEWAQNPYIKRTNMAFCLICEKLGELNDRLIQNPHVATIEVPYPDLELRQRFVAAAMENEPPPDLGEFTVESLAQLASGLSLVSLNVVLSRARQSGRPLEHAQFGQLKKRAIERQCQGLVSFVEPQHTLDLVVGHTVAKARLRQDARWLAEGRLDASPMGYLICGPVGTGKTFLAECYAGSVGIPCVKMRNIRSKYVGESEGNLQQVLTVLRSLGPVVVIVDEADAMLGDRGASGDSGTSARVFSMIASQMGDTRYRGKIVWMLLTCRPDLLPIDLKRQGRAEVHIPLFYPEDKDEIADMFRVMARKNGVSLASDSVPDVAPKSRLSGADIESVVLAAQRAAMSNEKEKVTRSDLQTAFAHFIPSADGLEKELQELVAVLECTDLSFLTETWKQQVALPNGRKQLQQRVLDIRRLIGE